MSNPQAAHAGNPSLLPHDNFRQPGALWIQEVLEEYYKKMVTASGGIEASGTSLFGIFLLEPLEPDDDRDDRPPPRVEVNLLGYELSKVKASPETPPPSDFSLTTLLILKVRYVVQCGEKMIEKTKVFRVKSPPEDREERDVVEISHVNKREIYFYTEVLPYLQNWTKTQNVQVPIRVSKCYYAKFTRSLGKTVAKDIELNFPYAESVLLLEDLGDRGYTERRYAQGLSVDEVKAAIYELAKIHAISWVIQERGEADGGPLFQFAHKELEAAVLYEVLLNKGIKALKTFIEGKPKAEVILKRIRHMEARLCGKLVALIEPSRSPAPTTLIHMHCSTENLVFRPKQFQDADHESGKHRIKNSRSDCKILHWQNFGRGRPTHDLGILMLTSMSPVERQAKTDLLLQYYYQVFKDMVFVFQRHHHLPFDLHCIKEEFRQSKLLALYFMIASIDSWLEEAATQERLLAVIHELMAEKLF